MGSVTALLDHSKELATVAPSTWKSHAENVDSTYLQGLPVFTTRWRASVECTMDEFLAYTLTDMDTAAEWDSACSEVECIRTHGCKDDLSTYANFARWRFKMPCPFRSRELLYLLVPVLTETGGYVICYLSVES